MDFDENLLKEFISGTAEVTAEFATLLEELPKDTSASAGSPLAKMHKSTTVLINSAEFIGLENTEKFLKQADAIFTAVKNKKIKVNQQFVSIMKKLFSDFTEVVAKTEAVEDILSIYALIETAQNIESGHFDDAPAIDADLLPDFISDTEDQISSAEENFLLLSKNGFNQDIVNTAYRNIHTIKGNCGFVHLYQLQNLCHAMETVMGGMRDKSIEVTDKNVSFLLEFLDEIKAAVTDLEKGGRGVVENSGNLIEKAKNTFPAAFGIKVEPKVEPQPEPKAEIVEEVKEIKEEKIEETEVEKTEVKHKETKDIKPEEKIVPAAISVEQLKEEIDNMVVSDDMRQNFISDSSEQLNAAEEAFLLLEKDGFEQETMNNAYRQIHSFKGNCGFMQLDDLKTISHTMETIMQFMREQKVPVDAESISFLLKLLDVLRNAVISYGQTGNGEIPEAGEYCLKALETFPQCFAGELIGNPVKPAKKKVVKEEKVKEQDKIVVESLSHNTVTNTPSPVNKQRQDLRVDLAKLEKIINLAGELVIAESMVSRNPAVEKLASESLSRSIYQLRKICNDLQDATMSLRMVPLSGLFKKMTRLVHDLSGHVGKKINLITEGEDTEVDKSVFELINDPLVHIIRNACDHGIETPKERRAAGKSDTGIITISGEHRSGAVWISVKDDGHGFNREKILKKAIEQGIISSEEQLSDDEILHLVLRPGFSTASVVSDISGRGVGMDVVQKNIENIKGQLFIKSQEGQGTEFVIRIPLTLAIIDGMIIKSANTLYIIPTLSIKQSLKYDKNIITHSTEQEEMLKYEDKLVPVVHIGNLFNKNLGEINEKGILIVVEENESLTALFVDDIVGQQQVVIKGLSEYINKTRGASGCTILGDGTVALILDIKTLTDMALEKAKSTLKIPVSKIKEKKEG